MTAHPVASHRTGLVGLQSWFAQGQRHWLALAALLVPVTALHLGSLLRTPPPFVDEAWYASRAWALIETGHPFGTFDAGVLDRYEGYWTFPSWLEAWPRSLAIRVLGLSLVSVRLVSLIFGLVLLVAVYVIGRELGGSRVGLTAALLTSLSASFMTSSHLARPDILVAALGFTALALYLTDRARGVSARSVLSGLVVGLAFDIHPNGVLYGLPILALYLANHRWGALWLPRFWGFGFGAGVALCFFLVTRVLPYPQTFIAMTYTLVGTTRTPPLLML